MGRFTMTKNASDIGGPTHLPEDWYEMEILSEPEISPNKKKQRGMTEEEGAGDNLVLTLRVNHEDPSFDGRRFTVWLPWPTERDAGTFSASGQTMEDWKLERIVAHAEAFGGSPAEGDEVEFSVGSCALFYVVQGFAQDGVTIRNDIDIRTKPRSVD